MKLESIIPPLSREKIETDAIRLIRCYQPNVLDGAGPFDVEEFVELDLEDLTGVQFEITEELPPEIHGLTDPSQNKLWVHADLANDRSVPGIRRYRSTLAHEVPHCIYHVKPIQRAGRLQIFSQRKGESGTELYRKTAIPWYLNPEWQAWNYAGALLMPRPVVIAMLREGATEIELADHFDVNRAFVRRRLEKLKI